MIKFKVFKVVIIEELVKVVVLLYDVDWIDFLINILYK